jgi:hypothetical protein
MGLPARSMSRCTCLWRDGRRVDGTHCPVHDTLTGVPPAEPAEPAEPDTDQLVADLRRRHATVMEGHCPRCGGRLVGAGYEAECEPCGIGYQASASPTGWQLREWITDDGGAAAPAGPAPTHAGP